MFPRFDSVFEACHTHSAIRAGRRVRCIRSNGSSALSLSNELREFNDTESRHRRCIGIQCYFSFFLICTGIATGSLARHRGRSFYPWFIFGALAWFVAIPWLLFTKSQLSDRAPPAGTVLLSSLAAACAAAVLVADLVLVPAKLPNCDYYSNISVLNKAVSGSSAGKAGGLEIITIKDVKEISRSKSDLRCTGTAQLNNSTAVAIDYRFFIEDGRLLGEAHWQ